MTLDSSPRLLTKISIFGALRTQTILSTSSRTKVQILIVLKRAWLLLIRPLLQNLKLDFESMLAELTKHFERLSGERLINPLREDPKDKQSF